MLAQESIVLAVIVGMHQKQCMWSDKCNFLSQQSLNLLELNKLRAILQASLSKITQAKTASWEMETLVWIDLTWTDIFHP